MKTPVIPLILALWLPAPLPAQTKSSPPPGAATPAKAPTTKPGVATPVSPKPRAGARLRRQWERPAAPVVSQWLNSLSTRRKIAQLVIAPIYGDSLPTSSPEYRTLDTLVHDVGIGGIILINRSERGVLRRAEPYEMVVFLNRLQRRARIPLLVAADPERGVAFRLNRVTEFPDAMAFGATNDLDATRRLGAATARQARALGIHWIFAPVADVNNNPDNPIINTRSFGEDPKQVAAHVKAFLDGANSEPRYPVITTVKHFPGHGDTVVDSHVALPIVKAGMERLEAVEFPPFREALEAGVDAIMTAHVAAPALDPTGRPATLSRSVLSTLLRETWGFEGIIVTDALDMGGVVGASDRIAAAVRAFEAGADVLLMPKDPQAAIEALYAAVRQKRISLRRLNRSVLRVLNAKYYAGLARTRLTDPSAVADQINTEEDSALAARAAESAFTLVKDPENLIPLREPRSSCFVLLTEGRFRQQGLVFLDELRKRGHASKIRLLDPDAEPSQTDEALRSLEACPLVVLGVFQSFASQGPGRSPLRGSLADFATRLIAGPPPTVVLSLGSPYLLRHFPKAKAMAVTYSPAPSAEAAAVRGLFGEIPISGSLPVTVPGVASVGDGLRRDVAPMAR